MAPRYGLIMNDAELIALLDSRFDTLTRTMNSQFEQVDKRFEQVDQRFEQVDQRFGRIEGRFDRLEGRTEEMETGLRHAFVQIESLRDETRRIIEAVILVDEKLERFRRDTARDFEEMKSFNRVSFRQIEEHSRNFDQRLTNVETRVAALEGRPPTSAS
ncbi:MAG TPA: hypothetical protein VKH35_06470 [Thermoanaerobaculia bacterium]|nr:hypothetical protein [Thermoanaerobaculia bacterium]